MIVNNIFENWKKGCYIATLKETIEDENGNEINYYNKAKHYDFNIQPAGGGTDIALYGEKVSKMYKTLISLPKYKDMFKEGDKAYLEGKKPINETSSKIYGIGANYRIVSVRPQNTVIVMHFEKI